MIFGKHINRYYLKYLGWLIVGLLALVMVDALQLVTPKLYRMVIDGMSGLQVNDLQGVASEFNMEFLLDKLRLTKTNSDFFSSMNQ